MSLNPKDEQAFNNLCAKPYKDQAVWFLNAYWKKFGEKEATNVFDYYHKCIELDEKKAAGNQLDELNAHRFLEKVDKTLTVVSLRDKLNKAGIDKNAKRKFVPLTHFLVIHYNVNPSELANAPQGDNQEEVERAQKLLEQVQHAFSEAQRTAELSHKAEVAAKQAQAELEAAKAELQAQEDAFNNRTAELQAKSTQGGAVQMNKAKNELAQHLSSDPLPLRKAKITNEAAVKKAEKASAAAEAARIAAENALEEATRKLAEAEAYLEEVKSRPGSAAGALWWIERELHEAKKYLPKSKGGLERK
eukprot:TRINITY_DN648_c0_g2_i2.p1 TRINITY_DN648_c0_g2~~TRINITY_DN648_c0_g2_i2.p1  ORF type:complete len:318 (-),score=105.18 TRINITY_DN648_c0_g2_i2:47-958(-)